MIVDIAPLGEGDLATADRIFRLAFGTFLGLPDPVQFMGDATLVEPRWRAAPEASFGAYIDGELVGSNLAARWGRFGFFGPLTIHPDHWGRGIASRLVAATMEAFDRWGIAQRGLFTFPDSAKHISLYGKFGFVRQAPTRVMVRGTGATKGTAARASAMDADAFASAMLAAQALTAAIEPGLDLSSEIAAVAVQRLGDTLFLHDDGGLAGFAVCHVGAGSEAGSDAAYVKFGAVRPGAGASGRFARLIDTCDAFAASAGAARLIAGVNAARNEALRMMVDAGFAPMIEGVAMQQPDRPGFNRPDCFVIDDWR